ncbi:MAG: hypothetical protein GX753_06085 [Erysipelothrix sp.]|nr:hypothetical protein [Erysipelothrix sp.]
MKDIFDSLLLILLTLLYLFIFIKLIKYVKTRRPKKALKAEEIKDYDKIKRKNPHTRNADEYNH